MTDIGVRSTTLADGRELIYFDDEGSSRRAKLSSDHRWLPPRPQTGELRHDALTGEWISVATARQNRAMLPPPELDPLAPQSVSRESEIPDDYDVAVFENRSPSFGPAVGDGSDSGPFALSRARPAVGRCEVVCFSPDRSGSFGSQTRTRARTVIEAWAHRVRALSQLPGVEQVFPFENRGEEIGVTLQHPHGQIYAYPYVTPRTQALIRSLEAYGPTLFSDILDNEQTGERVVLTSEHWCAFVPFAARWPLEVHMLPFRHVPDLAETSDAERDDLAKTYLRLLRGLDCIYDSPTPYIAAWRQAPVHSHRHDIRLMLQVTSPRRAADKLKYLAGSEAAMGAWIADVSPEEQADLIRGGVRKADREFPS